MTKSEIFLQRLIEKTKNRQIVWSRGSKDLIEVVNEYNSQNQNERYKILAMYTVKIKEFFVVSTKEVMIEPNVSDSHPFNVAYLISDKFQVIAEYNRGIIKNSTVLERLYMLASKEGYFEEDVLDDLLEYLEVEK